MNMALRDRSRPISSKVETFAVLQHKENGNFQNI